MSRTHGLSGGTIDRQSLLELGALSKLNTAGVSAAFRHQLKKEVKPQGIRGGSDARTV